MKVALDTNRYQDLCEGDPELMQLLEETRVIFLPFVVVAELRAGFGLGDKGRVNERVLRRFMNKTGVETLFPTHATTRAYANLYRQLRSQGTPIPTNDLWIAALVVEHDLVLVSRDSHFEQLPQLTVM